VVNVHPSLIPAFCGKGFYGHKVHEKVIESGVKVTGCTVHLVNNRYDQGPILAQGVVEVEDGDTPDTLAARVQAKERELYPKVVNDLLQGKIGVQGRKTRKLK
jgi:phosphoribosylglycinamide formyltransferase-1